MTPDEEDRIRRAEEIQRYTENRCEALEKENAELKAQIEKMQCCENCSKIDTCKLFAHIDISVCDKWSWQNDSSRTS